MGGGRRVLLSVSPRILSDALAEVLDAAGVTEVVVVEPGRAAGGDFDAAIVTEGADPAGASVVIRLPAETGTTVTVRTAAGDGEEVIDLRVAGGIIDLLDQRIGRADRPSPTPAQRRAEGTRASDRQQ